jgi:hypothetical protein
MRRLIHALIAVVGITSFALGDAATAQTVSGRSATCGPINGKTQKDMQNVQTFCTGVISRELGVETAFAMTSILWVQVRRDIADAMLSDRLTTERIVKQWISSWRSVSGSKAVTVYVRWGDVEIAKGETTILRGDQVTIRQR